MTISDPRARLNAKEECFGFPLSPAQERMWYAEREFPGNPAYNGSFRWILEGAVDAALVENTFDEIVRRHEALRTTFTTADGNPVQVVSSDLQVHVEVTDLRLIAAENRESEMDRLCDEAARRPFDIEKDDLIRVGLLRMGENGYVLMLTVHHLVSDGWSIGLMMEEFQKIYSAFAEGRQSPLPELPIQYADYTIWKQEQISSAENASQLNYWVNKLTGYRRLEVRPDFPSSIDRTGNAAIVSTLLPRDLTDALKDFSNQHGGTMFITSLSACMALLWQFTGERDIAVGSPLAGRNQTDVENLVGLFVNHVVLRASLEGDPTFVDFATRVRDTVWEAFANQDVPFETVLKALKPDIEVSPDPFSLINFICQREYARASEFIFEFAGIKMSTMPSRSQGALYDLNFFLVEREAGWRLSIEYKTDLYSDATAQKMLGHLQKLLEEIPNNPNRRLSEFPAVSQSAFPTTGAAAASEPKPDLGTALSKVPPSATASDAEVYAMPASVAQERFWLLSKFAPGNAAFHMPACVRLAGPLSEKALAESFHALISRHEILRTTFDEIDGKLCQIISSSNTLFLDAFNLPTPVGGETDANLEQLMREEVQRPFDLQAGPLFRAKLFRLGAGDHVLVVTLHHIIADGWSHNIFQQDLWSIYEALSQGRNSGLPQLVIQYGDFVAWQNEWLSSNVAQEHLHFWQEQLSEPLKIVDFPTDHPLSNRLCPKSGLETLLLPDDLTRSLKGRGQSENVTMFMLLMAGFILLLSRYADQTEIIVGSPVANRRPRPKCSLDHSRDQ